jgi:hypothetical protein
MKKAVPMLVFAALSVVPATHFLLMMFLYLRARKTVGELPAHQS